MSTTQEQKKKMKKSYEQLLEEAKSIMSKTAAVYVPELCQALKDERPELSNSEIRTQIELDLEGIWKSGTIRVSLPSWIFDQAIVRRNKKAYETRNANKLNSGKKILRELAAVDLPEPRIQEPDRTEEVDQQMHELGIAKFGESDKSVRELKGDITDAAARLFEALTQKHIPYDDDEDLIVDYIKPTREFRRSLSLELDEAARTTIHNWLHYTSVAIEDMMQIISEVKDK